MKKTILAFYLFLIAFYGVAQTKLLTIEDALVNNRGSLAVKNLRGAQFVYGSDDLVYLDNKDGKDVWIKKGSTTPYLTLEQLNEKLKTAGVEELKSMPLIQFSKSAEWVLTAGGNKIALDPITGKTRIIVDKKIAGKAHVEESTGGFVAYVDNFNLYVTDGKNGKQVTKDGSENIVYASSVHREEFGIAKGTFWSNNGKKTGVLQDGSKHGHRLSYH